MNTASYTACQCGPHVATVTLAPSPSHFSSPHRQTAIQQTSPPLPHLCTEHVSESRDQCCYAADGRLLDLLVLVLRSQPTTEAAVHALCGQTGVVWGGGSRSLAVLQIDAHFAVLGGSLQLDSKRSLCCPAYNNHHHQHHSKKEEDSCQLTCATPTMLLSTGWLLSPRSTGTNLSHTRSASADTL